MCSRYFVELSPELRPYVEQARRSALGIRMMRSLGRPLAREGVVRPTDIAPVIAPNTRGMKSVFPMIWGFTQADIEHTKRSQPLINARIETADRKPSWRESWQRRRCIIPASYYFEWERLLKPDGSKKPGDKYVIQPCGSDVCYMAGLYRMEDGYPHFAVLTRDAAPGLRRIHDRMPLILPASAISEWISPDSAPDRLREISESAITEVIAEKMDRLGERTVGRHGT